MFKFKNIKQLLAHFADEQTCWDYLEQKEWQGKPVCPHCGSTKVYRLSSDKRQFKCGNKKTCDKRFNVLIGTMFEGTKIPLSSWFGAIYLCTSHKKGISSVQLSKDLGIQQRTAWFLLHRIRTMAKPHTDVDLDKEIQIDETYLKGRTKNRTKNERRLIAIGEKEETTNIILGFRDKEKAILKLIPDTTNETIHKAIITTVKDRNTLIVTDAFKSYHGLFNYFPFRAVVNHAENEYKKAGYHTNSIESTFGLFKRTIYGTYHWISTKHATKYCDMFTHRFNMRKLTEYEKFDITLSKIKGRLTYESLIAPINPNPPKTI